jgi:hypothetical protein
MTEILLSSKCVTSAVKIIASFGTVYPFEYGNFFFRRNYNNGFAKGFSFFIAPTDHVPVSR